MLFHYTLRNYRFNLLMMKIPVVAIVGRPNVGKSTLVNRIVGSRQAIVDDLPGITRDRAYYDAQWQNRNFTLIDTGGLSPEDEEQFTLKINEQVLAGIEEADVVVFLVDGLTGVTTTDEHIAKILRKLDKPVILAVNKIDRQELTPNIHEFYSFDLGDPQGLSAMHGTVGVGDLLDKVMAAFDELGFETDTEELEEGVIRVAFAGRPNVGKSSLVNRLLGQERAIVSDIPGTTRDAIDTRLEVGEQTYMLVDTAGIRKKAKVAFGVEAFSVDRAIRALRRADVTVLVIDASEGVTQQDKRLIERSNEFGRALILVVNKWDTIENKTPKAIKQYEDELYHELPHARFAPVLFVSAKSGQRVDKILPLVNHVYANSHRHVQTSIVNQLILDAYSMSPPPKVKNNQLKIYYGTQVKEAPPTFLLFVNNGKLLKPTYRRYLEKHLRQSIEFTGTPLVLICRNRQEKSKA